MDAYCACDAYPIRHDPRWHTDGDGAAVRVAGGRVPEQRRDKAEWAVELIECYGAPSPITVREHHFPADYHDEL